MRENKSFEMKKPPNNCIYLFPEFYNGLNGSLRHLTQHDAALKETSHDSEIKEAQVREKGFFYDHILHWYFLSYSLEIIKGEMKV